MIVDAMDDMVRNCSTGDGCFYYKELPSLRRRGVVANLLEALAYAWEISGERRFLEAGMTTFEMVISAPRWSGNITGRKHVSGDAVIWETGASPKAFGRNFPSLMAFYRAARSEGVLE